MTDSKPNYSYSVLFTIALVLFAIGSSTACEICGCGNNNFQVGMLPSFSKGFVGLRYTGSIYHSKMRADASEYGNDYYRTTELWGGYNFKRFQAIGFIPYSYARKISDDGTTHSNGFGDALIILNYKLLTSTWLSSNEVNTGRNEFYFGAGVKFPTGKSQIDVSSTDFNIGDFNSQAGTGSVDYILNFTHNLQWNDQGIVSNVAYRLNSTNNQDYRFGNRFYLNSSYFYTFSLSSIKLRPNAGVNLQQNAINTFQGAEVEDSNGYTINSTLGINLIRKKMGLNALAFVPLAQDLNGGQTKLQSRLILGLTYSF